MWVPILEKQLKFLKKFKIKKIYSFEASPENFKVLKKKFPLSKKNLI